MPYLNIYQQAIENPAETHHHAQQGRSPGHQADRYADRCQNSRPSGVAPLYNALGPGTGTSGGVLLSDALPMTGARPVTLFAKL